MYGFHNRVAWIDLTSGQIEAKPLDEQDVREFVGGSNLAASILAKLIDADTDPLGPENPLIFMTGPFTATRAPSGSRHTIVSLSPQTGIFAESNSGGSMGWHLKRAGWDGLVITGAASEPKTIVIDQDEISLSPADELWGQDVFSADEALKAQVDDKRAVTALIGPGGENQVLYASVSHDGRHTRSAGRCGMGAVMGSKKLKAVVVTSRGSQKVPVADPERLKAVIKEKLPVMKDRLAAFSGLGTTGGVLNYHKMGNLPIKNWQLAQAPELAEKTTGTVMAETHNVGRTGCKGCPVQCARLSECKEGPFATDGVSEGPEYETLAGFGTLLMNDNLDAIVKANELCNNWGLDTISTAATIAWAIECAEKGALTEDQLDGLELDWGKMDTVMELIRRIAFQEGDLARTLGLGVARASEIIGRNAAEYAIHVKGLEFPMHDPRFSWGHAISYQTANRGSCHLSTVSHMYEIAVTLPELGHDEPLPHREESHKPALVFNLQNLMNLQDSLIACRFSMLNNAVRISDWLEWYNTIMGTELSVDEFMTLGARGFNLKRMINNMRGVSRKDDIMPPRMRTLKKQGGDIDFPVPPYLPMLSAYYDLRGWTEEGLVSGKNIEELGLARFAR